MIQRALQVCLLLAATTARGLAEVTGAVFYTFIIEAAHPLAVALKKAGTTYFEEVKAAGKGHSLGPPFIHLFKEMIQWLADNDEIHEVAAEVLNTFWDNVVLEVPLMQLVDDISWLSFRRAFKKKGEKQMMKLVIRFPQSEMEVEQVVVKSLVKVGAERKHGPPPKNGLERDVRRMIEALQKQ